MEEGKSARAWQFDNMRPEWWQTRGTAASQFTMAGARIKLKHL
jgi:hypothetical protein